MAPIATPAQQTRRAFFRRLRWYCIASGTVLLLIGAFGLVVRSSILRGAQLVVVGAPAESEEVIARELRNEVLGMTRSGMLGTDHYLAWPSGYSYSAAAAATVSIDKTFSTKTITATVTPRARYAVWCAGPSSADDNVCYWIDNLGIVFDAAPAAEGQLVRTIYASSDAERPMIGRTAVPPATFSIIKKIIDGLADLPTAITTIDYDATTQELILKTEASTTIRLSTRFDPSATALPALRRLIEKPGLAHLEYINLTVENRAFVKKR